MFAATQQIAESADVILKTSVIRSESTNPAILRLRGRVLADAESSEVITSYDRMHHRHNRS